MKRNMIKTEFYSKLQTKEKCHISTNDKVMVS